MFGICTIFNNFLFCHVVSGGFYDYNGTGQTSHTTMLPKVQSQNSSCEKDPGFLKLKPES